VIKIENMNLTHSAGEITNQLDCNGAGFGCVKIKVQIMEEYNNRMATSRVREGTDGLTSGFGSES
jgi:hypothetical protein